MTISSNYFIIACSGSDSGIVISAAERYAFVASFVSIPLMVAAAGIFLYFRYSLRACILNCIPLMLHPAWLVSARGGDCGITLRTLSTIWIVLSILLVTNAAIAIGLKEIRHIRLNSITWPRRGVAGAATITRGHRLRGRPRRR